MALPEWFGEQLVNLEVLVLKNCHKLGSLPESISGLKALKVLDLSSDAKKERWSNANIPMSIRALPEGFGKMASLEDLSLAYCHALAKNEGTFTILSQIPTLTKLSLANCDMESLPAGTHPQ